MWAPFPNVIENPFESALMKHRMKKKTAVKSPLYKNSAAAAASRVKDCCHA